MWEDRFAKTHGKANMVTVPVDPEGSSEGISRDYADFSAKAEAGRITSA